MGDPVIYKEGNIGKQEPPCCSFNFAIALAAYNERVMLDAENPEIPFEAGKHLNYAQKWRQSHNPTTWISNSCLWYSQEIIGMLDMDKFRRYVDMFGYGNKDLTGMRGEPLKNAWLTTLKISAEEKVAFLENLINSRFKEISSHAYDMIRKIFLVDVESPDLNLPKGLELPEGWKLYGKTGASNARNPDGSDNLEVAGGWFSGWLEHSDGRTITFAHYAESKDYKIPAGFARKQTIKKLVGLISSGKL
jgi:beta-lactamase class D